MQKRNKKGFNLAELLIVVATIAVLVAIAVPIFVTALNKAEQGVINANERSLKAMAVVEILGEKSDKYKTAGTEGDTVKKLRGPWYAYAECDKDGNITVTGDWISTEKDGTKKSGKKETGSGYTLYVEIKAADLK